MNRALLVAGRIRSGKSSISRALAARLDASYASFGDEVRDRARRAGIDPGNRTELQNLGQQIVSADADEFIDAVLARAVPPLQNDRDIVIDGVRHISIVRRLRQRLAQHDVALVYIDAADAVRQERTSLEGTDATEALAADSHSNEAEVEELRSRANFVVTGEADAATVAADVVCVLRKAEA